MRQHFKYLFLESGKKITSDIDISPDEHRETMGGYRTDKGFSSKEDFFTTFIKDRKRHYYAYDEYLKENLDKRHKIISIGSGQCIPEISSIEEGFDITCSDIEFYSKDATLRLFPNVKFLTGDIVSWKHPDKYDCVVCLSVLYVFEKELFCKAVENIYGMLNNDGVLILDVGGTEDNLFVFLLDNFLCRADMYLRKIFKPIFQGKDVVVVKKHHGYRRNNKEIVSMVEKAGFKYVSLDTFEHCIELSRLKIFEIMPRSIVSLLGKMCPYIRIFKFIKQ
jgi:hypothetical protein